MREIAPMMKTVFVAAILCLLCGGPSAMPFGSPAPSEKIPKLKSVPAELPPRFEGGLAEKKRNLEAELAAFLVDAERFNNRTAEEQSAAEYSALEERRTQFIGKAKAFNKEVAELGDCRVTFYAYGAGTRKPSGFPSPSGHFYVGFQSNSEKIMVVKGMSPGAILELGHLEDDADLVNIAQRNLSFVVSKDAFHRALNITMRRGYVIGENDCVSYGRLVAEAIGLTIEPRVYDMTPIGFIEKLRDLNGR